MPTITCLFTHSYDSAWFAELQLHWAGQGWSAVALESLPDQLAAPLVWFSNFPFAGHEQVLRLARRDQVALLPVHTSTNVNLGPLIAGVSAPCLECLIQTYAMFNSVVAPAQELSALPAAALASGIVEMLHGRPAGSMRRINQSGQRDQVRIPRNPLCRVCSRYAFYPLEQLHQPISQSVAR
jgi:hypothetical protein